LSAEPDFSWISAREGASLHLKVGEIVFKAGDPMDDMYLVRSGRIDIVLNGRVVEQVGANQIFGEMALIDNTERSADAVVGEDAELVPINEKLFTFLVHETPRFALDVMRVLAHRLRRVERY